MQYSIYRFPFFENHVHVRTTFSLMYCHHTSPATTMQKEKSVAKDVRSAVSLEQELQIAYAQKCVAVLDVYSSEWGNCKAIQETFQRLKTEAGDDLRFFTVECNSILDSLKHPDDNARHHQRPKNIEALRDTLPEVWQPILEERQGQSEPCFVFYKEGKKCNQIIGVNTPAIRALVKDLCTVKTPASEFITNSRLQDVWDEYFNPEESEIPFDKFIKAIMQICKYTVSLSDEEKNVLLEAIGVAKDNKNRIVHAEGVQKWFGDDESRTIQQAFTETLPDYEERAAQVKLEREAEEKRRQEEEEKRKAEEEKAALERKAEEDRLEEERRAANPEKTPKERLRELDNEIAELLTTLGSENADEFVEGEAEAAVRSEVDADLSAREARVVESSALTTPETAIETATAILAAMKAAGALTAELSAKTKLLTINAAANALDKRTEANDALATAKLAAAILTFSAEDAKKILDIDNDFAAQVANGSLPTDYPAVFSTVSALLAKDAPELYWIGASTDLLAADSTVGFSPLTALYHDASAATEGKVAVKVTGLKNYIDHRPYSRYPSDAFGYTAWFATGKVAAVEDGFEIAIDSIPSEDDYVSACASIAADAKADSEKLRNISTVQAKKQERDALAPQITPTPPPEEKPATPAEGEKPVTPEGEKPATPAEGEKPAEGEEKPASKPGTPGENAEKPATPGDAAKPATPAEGEKPASKPATPGEGEKPASKPATPGEAEKPASKPASKPATPDDSAQKPAEEAPAATEEAKPSEEKPATPAEEAKPAEAEAKPATPPEAEKPAEPAAASEEKPATPAEGEKPAEEKPATPAEGEKPAEGEAPASS